MTAQRTFEQAVSDFLKGIDLEIPPDSGTFNKFCPNCFYRNGHPLVWCRQCGTAMVIYSKQDVRPTWRNYILKAREDWEKESRAKEFIYALGIPYRQYKDYGVEFNFIWYIKSPDCTTLLFANAILKAIKEKPVSEGG